MTFEFIYNIDQYQNLVDELHYLMMLVSFRALQIKAIWNAHIPLLIFVNHLNIDH